MLEDMVAGLIGAVKVCWLTYPAPCALLCTSPPPPVPHTFGPFPSCRNWKILSRTPVLGALASTETPSIHHNAPRAMTWWVLRPFLNADSLPSQSRPLLRTRHPKRHRPLRQGQRLEFQAARARPHQRLRFVVILRSRIRP